jgi:hypothetical protein
MNNNNDERRNEPRSDVHAAVFLEVDSPEPESGERPTVILCRILDVSANGMKIRVDRELPETAILRLCADFGRDRSPLEVVGEVRWCREEGEYFEAGFVLYDSAYTDIEAWKKLISADPGVG